MDRDNIKTLCRICLRNGAKNVIFKEIKEENSVYSKLCECFKEKIEDIEGYPRFICDTCKDTLDIVYEFVIKFRNSQEVLKRNIVSVKLEESDNEDAQSDFETEPAPEIEIELDCIKTEPKALSDYENTEYLIQYLQPDDNESQDEKVTTETNISIKTEKKPFKSKNKYENRTSKIATSILEGEFAWTGENWCLKSTIVKIPKIKQEIKPKRKNNRLKLPRKPTLKMPKLCDLCGDSFNTANKLRLHRIKIHINKPVQCKECKKTYSSDKNLEKHVIRKHGGDRQFVCTICGGSFAFKAELRNHISKMHKNKPKKVFQCKYCSKTYLSQKSIIIHERSAHTGERPVECSVCFKGFFHEDYLKEHMRLHTGEAPFKCPVCGRGYAQRGNMKSHLRIHRITEVDAVTLSKMRPNYLKLLKI